MRRTTFLFIPLLGVLALAVVVALAGAHDEPTQFQRVAEHPERFAGKHVRVTGRIVARQHGVPPDDALVLEGPTGRHLVALVDGAADDARLAVGVRVSARGTVEPLPASADERRGDRPHDPVSLTDLAQRYDTETILRAGEVVARPR